MRLPRTSMTGNAELPEVRLGRGDYAMGGARSLPFLDLDNARRRRPLVFGEVVDDLSGYPDLAAGMFSGRQSDPAEWSVMWKEIGADGICLRLSDPEEGAGLVEEISGRTGLPVAVDSAGRIPDAMMEIDGTRLLVLSQDSAGRHVACRTFDGADDASAGLDGFEGEAAVMFRGTPREACKEMEEYRSRGLSGDASCRFPMVADTTSVWDSADGGRTARRMSLLEASAALSAMLAGADLLIMRGPGAADMARVYGEELADL